MKIYIFLALCTILSGCSSISCRYAPLNSKDERPSDLPIGMILKNNIMMIGVIGESVDNSSINYMNIVEPPGYKNRFVKQSINIPKNTIFNIIGYRRPFNPICYNYDWELVLALSDQFNSRYSEIHIAFALARNNNIFTKSARIKN